MKQLGLLIILLLIMFVPPFQALLADAIFGFVELLTAPFGVWTHVASVLQRVLSV